MEMTTPVYSNAGQSGQQAGRMQFVMEERYGQDPATLPTPNDARRAEHQRRWLHGAAAAEHARWTLCCSYLQRCRCDACTDVSAGFGAALSCEMPNASSTSAICSNTCNVMMDAPLVPQGGTAAGGGKNCRGARLLGTAAELGGERLLPLGLACHNCISLSLQPLGCAQLREDRLDSHGFILSCGQNQAQTRRNREEFIVRTRVTAQ